MRRRTYPSVLLAVITMSAPMLCAVALTHPLEAQPAAKTSDIAELMSAREFASAGLQKLTPQELAALSAWVHRHAQAVERRTAPLAAPKVAVAPEVIETQIDDEFEGWDGDTIFKLRNGQIWQQISYEYAYHYAYSPDVLIYRSGGAYKMKVEGVDGEISVRRLK